ncbi:MAG: hypothetical protein ACLTYN_07465 [Dysosmobacter welbionis]
MDFERDWLDDARRYYTNIVGKYGAQVQSLLKRAAGMEIQMICPSTVPSGGENLEWFLEKYQRWSTYTPKIGAWPSSAAPSTATRRTPRRSRPPAWQRGA